MSKYPIHKEFFPFSYFTPPISEKFLAMAVPHMKTPKFIFMDSKIDVVRYEVESYDGAKIEVFLMSPKALDKKASTTKAALEARIRFMKKWYSEL